MTEFLIFVAPFLVLFGSMIAGFWLAMKDGPVTKDRK
ncbi:cytochrome bd oxidase small subunit CydS [Indiicoccus explosivorum]